jgi:tetratricopeptide (TPR) repeat protein
MAALALGSMGWGLTPAAAARGGAPLLAGLDGYTHAVETRHPLAARYFNQAMMLVYGFNPEEAMRSFEAAVALDPQFASAWWGLAWAIGPNINTDLNPRHEPRLLQALAQARRHAGRATPVMRDLIAALSLRHPGAGRIDEEAYATRLLTLARRHARSAEVALLAAEAQLNLHPYDWWDAAGQPLAWTPGIEALLQRSLRLQPRQPGAHHYWIHLQESSAHPQRGLASADALRDAHPGSGHLLHMPSHIDMRMGRYADAMRANQRGIAADEHYLQQVDAQGSYRVGYVAHNHHFLWAAACMAGQPLVAQAAAEAAWSAACGPQGRDPGLAITAHYAVLPAFTRVRFGQWPEMLRHAPPPDVPGPYALALWHYARGTAHAHLREPEAAQQELHKLQQLSADPALDRVKVKNINPGSTVLRIATHTLRADLALLAGKADSAVDEMRQAVTLEDGFNYDEPHLWLAPARQALGATLLAAGRPQEAERAYREDLVHYPANAWSLTGLAQALDAQGHGPGAARVQDQRRLALAQGAHQPRNSRF